MGWKNVKEQYRIDHYVCVTEAGICIGSGYVHDLIVVKDGKPEWGVLGPSRNDKLARYFQEMEENPRRLCELIEAPDRFERSIPVFTYDYDGNIHERACEVLGWPNCTHDGEMMYENMFFAERGQAIEKARRELLCATESVRREILREETILEAKRAQLSGYEAAAGKLAQIG